MDDIFFRLAGRTSSVQTSMAVANLINLLNFNERRKARREKVVIHLMVPCSYYGFKALRYAVFGERATIIAIRCIGCNVWNLH